MTLVSRLTNGYSRFTDIQDRLGDPGVKWVTLGGPNLPVAAMRLNCTRVTKANMGAFLSENVDISHETEIIELPRLYPEADLLIATYQIGAVRADLVMIDTSDPVIYKIYVNPKRHR